MTRKGVSKALKKPIPEEYNRLPNIVPVQSAYHSLLPSVKNEVNSLIGAHYSAYHVWLDCLYEANVTYDVILDGLKPLLDSSKRRTIKIRNIFILGHRFDDGSYKPGGSCYLMIPDAFSGQSKNRNFQLDILESGLHMSRVETEVMLRQLSRYPTLVLTDGFKEQLTQIPIDDLSKVCKLNTPIPTPRAAHPVDQQLQSKKQAGNKQQQQQVANKAVPSQPAPSRPSSNQPSVSSQSVENIARLLQQTSIANQQSSSNGLPKPQNGLNNLNNVVHKTKVYKASNGILNQEMFEARLLQDVEESEKRSKKVSTILPTLLKFGNTVIKIENLPAKLTVHALNLMMGTYSLISDQIVAISLPSEKGQLMNIRIVMQSANPDMQRIVSKNMWRTSYDTLLFIKRTDLKELEAFLNENYNKFYSLETSDKLPVNSIGYGKLLTN